MNLVHEVPDLRAALAPAPRPIGLVPTMGALHEGHLSLVRAARERCATVVVSVFVNPRQFDAPDDLAAYPRTLEHDAELAREAGADVVFAPAAETVYPPGFSTFVEVVGPLTHELEGDPEQRGSGHFRGVTTVVAKLFNMVAPQIAFFGQKDAQQALVIRRMARDLDFPVEIETLPTVRDHDGLALSSRNLRLSAADRERALALSRALRTAEARVAAGERDASRVLGVARAELEAAGVEADYLELRSAADLAPVQRLDKAALLCLAARVGGVRLIDNVVLRAPAEAASPTPQLTGAAP